MKRAAPELLPPDAPVAEVSGDALALAEACAPQIESAAAETEAIRELAPSVVKALLDGGLYRMLLPRTLGGFELPPSRFVRVIERIARADASTAWCLCQTSGCAMSGGHLEPHEARAIFGPRRAVLAWGAGPKGRAVAVPGGYEISGTWLFASGSRQATWLGAHIPLCEPDGTPRHGADGKALQRTVIFPADQARITDVWHVMGLKGTGSDNYSVERMFIPEARTFLLEGQPHPTQIGVLYRFPITLVYAAGFASVAFGIARALFDSFVDLARNKVPHNQKDPLRDSPVTQMHVAQAEAKLASARTYLWRSLEDIEAELVSAGQRTLSPDQRMRIRLAATFGIHQAKEVADMVYRAAGSTAIFENGAFERRFRDLHAVTQQLQGRLAHYETVGQYLLGVVSDPSNH
jgi:alkylation response protein AidB-like acyl-CoA dehydrogenase